MKLMGLLVLCTSAFTTLKAQAVASAQGTSSVDVMDAVLARRVTVNVANARLSDALKSVATQLGVRVAYGEPVRNAPKVSLAVKDVPASQALSALLKGTGLRYRTELNNQIIVDLGEGQSSAKKGQGVVAGKVTDAKTGKGIPNASVSFDDDHQGVVTAEDGSYRLTGIAAGVRRITVRLVGYAKQSRSVSVMEGSSVTVDFKLEPSANVLDQVVVTGTVASTELRAVPSAITVITASQIEQRGITRIDQLFRGDIPGLFSVNQGSANPLGQVTMMSRGVSSLSTSFGATPPIKTYIDGVEMADPKYISQIDPKSIERIEILTGPQASTIYGSNALGGVMQVFTKRGTTTRPQLTATLLSGLVQNNFTAATAPQHDYSAAVSGLEGKFSYSTGGSWYYVAPWSPATQQQRLSAYGGSRVDWSTPLGGLGLDGSVRTSTTRNVNIGGSQSHELIVGGATGQLVRNNARTVPLIQSVRGRTSSLSIKFTPMSWWSHEVAVGNDLSDLELLWTSPSYVATFDTSIVFRQTKTGKRSERYQSTAQIPVSSFLSATLTLGVDHWRSKGSDVLGSGNPSLVGSLASPSITRSVPEKNAGAFFQGQMGMRDALYLTYGVRAEWNPNYGDESQPNIAPKIGFAYTRDFSVITAKLRATYGRSTRPPARTQKDAVANTTASLIALYGPFPYERLANQDLNPEYQQGGEGGLELYLGSRASVVVTRYNQTTDNLIRGVPVDSVRSLAPCPSTCSASTSFRDDDGYAFRRILQNLNVGSIRNQGWLLETTINTGPFTTRGAYSWTKSRVLGITPRYSYLFPASASPELQPGAVFNWLPEHTWSVNTAYANRRSRISLNLNGTGFLYREFDQVRLTSNISRLITDFPRVGAPTGYRSMGPRYVMADLAGSHALSSRAEVLLQVQNLGNYYRNDYDLRNAVVGRQSNAGVRVRF